MQIITWNIQWGLGMDGVLDLARIVKHARSLADFDVLCLQEVADNLPALKGSRGENQFAILADLLPGYRAIVGAPLEVFDDAGAMCRFGNMILSRRPVRQVLRHTLPWPGGAHRSMPRMLLEATVLTPLGPVRVATTHLEYHSADHRARQVEAIRAAHLLACDRANRPREPGDGPYTMQPHPHSAILTGDFNMRPSDATRERLCAPFGDDGPPFQDAWTVRHGEAPHPPSFCISEQTYGEPHCCDYVFVTADLAPYVDAVQYDTETRLSDHQPLVVTLKARDTTADSARIGR